MDYEFSLDEYDRPIAEFSMGFEALGRWLSEELGNDQLLIEELLDIIQQLEQQRVNDRLLFGENFQLAINQHEVTVTALALDGEPAQELPEDTRLYDDELYASCGLPDFKQALLSWQVFVGE